MKIFGIGFQRTGTTTLGQCFLQLGFRSRGWVAKDSIPLCEYWYNEDYDNLFGFLINDTYDSYEDAPWWFPQLYKKIDNEIPNCKFILTIRDSDKWINSVINAWDGYAPDYPRLMPVHSKVYQRIDQLASNNRYKIIGFENHYKAIYEKHNSDVMEYFKNRPEDLLVLDWEKDKSYHKLALFLDRSIPNQPIPCLNTSGEILALKRSKNIEIKMKKDFKELAIFGHPPAFSEKLHVGRPNIGNREKLMQRFNDLLDRKWLSNNGIYVQELERHIGEMLGVKHCIAMCNGTVALEIVIRATELKGEVIVPSFTFIATAHALQWQEITPVFCDINPKTHTIDPLTIEKMITPKTTGIIGVHIWGQPCDVNALTSIANKHNLKLLFDASHAFGCSYQGKMIGNFGEAEVFSFHATKFVNTFEGGAVVTNNDELANKIRLMKNFGFAGFDNVVYIGTNGKMDEASAAMGLTSIESIDDFIKINHSNYEEYKKQLANLPGIALFPYHDNEKCNYQYIVLELDAKITKITQEQLLTILHSENIIARRYFYPGCHRMEPYRSYFPHAKLLLPETEKIVERIIILPTGTGVNKEDIIQICSIIKLAINNSDSIKNIVVSK